MKLSTRITFSFVLAASFTTILGVGSYLATQHLAGALADSYENCLLPVDELGRANILQGKIARRLNNYFLSRSSAERQENLVQITEMAKQFDEILKAYTAHTLSLEERAEFEQFKAAAGVYRDARKKAFELDKDGTNSKVAIAFLLDEVRPKLNDVDTILFKLGGMARENAKRINANAVTTAHSITLALIAAIVFSLGVCLAIGALLLRYITRQVGGEPAENAGIARRIAEGDLSVAVKVQAGDSTSMTASIASLAQTLTTVVEHVKQIAAGDLTIEVKVKEGDTTSVMVSLRSMATKLSEVIASVRAAADALASSSEQLSATAESVSQASTEQSASAEETSSAMEQMSASIAKNNENAQLTGTMAVNAAKDATEGGVAVRATVDAMKQIAHKISVIDDIAYQTNLLALNAAIEAGRAGE